MTHFSALATLTFKLTFLVCLSLMNLAPVQAVAPSPCHEMTQHEAVSETEALPCDACLESEKAWDQPLISAGNILLFSPVTETALVPEFLLTERALATENTQKEPDPPPSLQATQAERLAKQTIVLVI
ncbi:MAG: hypothetical protein K9M51_03765 [Candidatus Gracilibacteria bacterium]|nr:hypothetical protein [Candidatus Gracilibacteria bacterium]